MFEIWTRDCTIEGADAYTELWRPWYENVHIIFKSPYSHRLIIPSIHGSMCQEGESFLSVLLWQACPIVRPFIVKSLRSTKHEKHFTSLSMSLIDLLAEKMFLGKRLRIVNLFFTASIKQWNIIGRPLHWLR